MLVRIFNWFWLCCVWWAPGKREQRKFRIEYKNKNTDYKEWWLVQVLVQLCSNSIIKAIKVKKTLSVPDLSRIIATPYKLYGIPAVYPRNKGFSNTNNGQLVQVS